MKKSQKQSNWDQVEALRSRAGLASYNDPGFTGYEYARRYGLNYNTAAGQLTKLVERGLLIKGRRTITTASGIRRHQSVYRPAPQEATR